MLMWMRLLLLLLLCFGFGFATEEEERRYLAMPCHAMPCYAMPCLACWVGQACTKADGRRTTAMEGKSREETGGTRRVFVFLFLACFRKKK